jgi:PIN domain nuclease of toxin-antitoxin system
VTENSVVLDASAILALVQGEPGADEVESLLDGASMSSVNLSEVIQKGEQHDVNTEGLEYDLEALGIGFRDFGVAAARPTAALWATGSGLSLGDRACLSLAVELELPAVTADRRWAAIEVPIPVRVVR